MIITDEFTKIVKEFSNLKHISSETEHIYSNITYYITTLVFQYNEIIEEKDHIILDNILATYSTLHNAEELSKSNIIYNSAITRTYTDEYNEYVSNLQISPEKYNILATKLQKIVIIYNDILDMYNIELIDNISLLNKKTRELAITIVTFNIVIETESTIYSIRLFSILLNIFVKNFRIMTYDERVTNLSVLKTEYIKYLRNLKKLNTAFIISYLHKIYITPILLLSNTEEAIILKDSATTSKNLSSYYGIISPDFIQFEANILPTDIRSNLLDDSRQIYEITYNGNIIFYPDYRNKTYEIEIIAYSMLISQQKYKLIITENGFPAINPVDFIDSNIKLGKINNNTFKLNLCNYYSASNVVFMIDSNYSIASNLTYDDIYIYKAEYIDYCNIPIITDTITITPYIAGGYPILFEEYSNTPVILDVISSPTITITNLSFTLKDVSVFTYDLTVINAWYINVVEASIITFEYITTTHSVPRSNLKEPSRPIVEIDSNILKVNPDYRGESYDIRVNIESPNDYALCNIIEITITEDGVPIPVRTVTNLLLEHLLLKDAMVFNANSYFNSGTGENLRFEYDVSNIIDYTSNIALNELPYDTFEITTSNLRFTPDYRNIGYTLQIYAIDTVYNVSSDDVLEINVREDKILNIREDKILDNNEYELGNDILIINIEDHIELPVGKASQYTLTYHVSIDKALRTSIKNDTDAVYMSTTDTLLYIDPDYRNDSYNVNILVEAYSNSVYKDNINFTFSVSEVIAPYPKIKNTNVVIVPPVNNTSYNKDTNTLYINELTISTSNINLDLFFINEITDNENRYEITEENTACYRINDNNLIIKPNVRDITHKFSIMATDSTYLTYNSNESNLLNVELMELPPIRLKNNSNLCNLSNNEIVINLAEIFRSTISSVTLEYDITITSDNDIRANMSPLYSNIFELDTSSLRLYPDYRGISYRLNVIGTNPNYITQPVTYYIDINEAYRLPIETKINTIKINMERFKYYPDNIKINLEELFVHFRYYPEYSLILDSDNMINFDQYIYISLGDLIISKFDYEFNFTIKVILLNTPNEINIKFVNTLHTLINKASKISLPELTEQYRYTVSGLNGSNISPFVQILDNKINIKKTSDSSGYAFVLNKVHKDLSVEVEQIFYKVDKVASIEV